MIPPSHLLALPLILIIQLPPSTASSQHAFQEEILAPPTSSPLPPLTYIPPLGLGLWQSHGPNLTTAISSALSTGYRHLDSAAAYSNEATVGKALSDSSLPRSAYWLTSKLWNTAHSPSAVEPALRQTLSDLNTSYVDLYLMHWPVAFHPSNSSYDNTTSITSTWHAMESLRRLGLTRHIGISNFSPGQLTQIIDHCLAGGHCPVAHEFETHPYLQQQAFVDLHRRLGIQIIAYSPLGNLNPIYDSPSLPSILEDPFWMKTAERKNVTVAQAVLGWNMQRGVVVIPKSVHEARIAENWGANGVGKEMAEMAQQDKKVRFNNPSKEWGVQGKLFEGLDGA
jgi:alcohol dehydrogenase (NADP+)